ncbi:MAG: amidohydrolase family protein [Caldilineaceae bacterium]
MIDADLLLGHYPFRPLPHASADPQQLKAYLQERGVARACLASLHAAFYADPAQGDAEVLPQLMHDDFFLPVATINPALHNWRTTLRRAVDEYGCRSVRLIPNYHQYPLNAPFVDAFLDAAQAHGLLVTIVKRLEDERMHPPLMKVPGVANRDIVALGQRYPQPVLLLSAYFAEIKDLAAATANLYFDIAFAETLNTLPRLTETVPPAHLLFGTHTPFFYPEAAIGKITQWQASAETRDAVVRGNLLHLLSAVER